MISHLIIFTTINFTFLGLIILLLLFNLTLVYFIVWSFFIIFEMTITHSRPHKVRVYRILIETHRTSLQMSSHFTSESIA